MPRMQRPDGRPINLKYETKRQSLDRPAYGAHLPKCFPFRIKLSPEDATRLSAWLLNHPYESEVWHAVTGHPATADEWVYLWLSRGAVAALVSEELISEGNVEESIPGGR